MGQDPADHFFLARREVNLGRRELGMPENELHVGERQRRVLGHPVGSRVTQRVQRRRRPGPLVDPLEHAVHRVVGQRPGRTPGRPPQRLPPARGDQPGHLDLVEPQPHERVGGRRQLLQLAGALPDHRDQLPSRVGAGQRRRQQFRRPRPRRHVERDQRPVPVRRQPCEDLVELAVRDTARDPVRHPRPVEPAALVAVGLHRVMVRVRPPSPPRPVKRERVDQRPAARIQVKVVEGPQHRLGMRANRRRIRHASRNGRHASPVTATPVRPGLLPGNLQPPGEIAGLRTGCLIPRHPDRPQEPEPPQQVHAIGADRGLGPARRQKISEESRDGSHRRSVSADQPVRLVTITRRRQPAVLGNHQRRQIPGRLIVSGHDARPCQGKPRHAR